MLELVTDAGVQEVDIDQNGSIKEVTKSLNDLERAHGHDRIRLIICQRNSTRLTLFDMLLARLHVAVLVVASGNGILYPTSVLRRRAAALCLDV